MFKTSSLLSVFCICIALLGCTENPVSSKPPRELRVAEKRLIESDNRFGIKLFREINIQEEKGKNIFISPLSVSMALGMTYNGTDESTKEAMEKTLELSGLAVQEINESYKDLIELLTGLDRKVKFQIANSIWYRQSWSFEEEFINLCKAYFNAEVSGLDFNDPGASEIINSWVDRNTNGKIEKIVDDVIDPYTVMFLINAIYFKGTWTYEFDKKLTSDDQFNLPDGSKSPCKMMVQEGDFQYFETDDFQAIDLPYGDERFSMTIFLPKPQVDVDYLVKQLDQESWDHWINSFSKRSVKLFFPKFALKYEIKLNDVLKALGMEIAFDPYQADFTKMYEGPENLYISKVKHKTFVKVDEEGTEAAAATSVGIVPTSIEPYVLIMRVDRPFVFAIRENYSQTILFIGKIVEPSLE